MNNSSLFFNTFFSENYTIFISTHSPAFTQHRTLQRNVRYNIIDITMCIFMFKRTYFRSENSKIKDTLQIIENDLVKRSSPIQEVFRTTA